MDCDVTDRHSPQRHGLLRDSASLGVGAGQGKTP